MTAVIAIYGLGRAVMPYIVVTTIPYLIVTELYTRKIERVRYLEREAYAFSIVFIRDYIYENKGEESLKRVFKRWKHHVDKIMWYDRLFFASSYAIAFTSTAVVSYVVGLEAINGKISLGGVAGLISAFLTTHIGLINAMWAICIQGQVKAAYERVAKCLQL